MTELVSGHAAPTDRKADVRIDPLTREVVHLAGLAGEAIELATDALLEGRMSTADVVIRTDGQLDALAARIERMALRQMQDDAGGELGPALAAIRVVHELERVGDNMVNVAKAARRLLGQEFQPRVRGLVQRMREQAVLQLRVAVRAWAEHDAALAAALTDLDDVMDDLEKELLRAVLAGSAGEDGMQRAVQLALVGRYYERAGDHAVNFGKRACAVQRTSGEPAASG